MRTDILSQDRPPCILFCGGGTGGHLMPGLSVAEEIRGRLPEARLAFAGTGRGREHEWVTDRGFEFHGLPAAPWGAGLAKAARFACRTMAGLVGALLLEGRLSPHVVVGLGGYGSLAPGMAAALGRRRLVLMEQNAIPGKANRLLSRWACEVYCAWDDASPHFKRPERVHAIGNPIRRSLLAKPCEDAARAFGLSPGKRTLLVMGGSLGAAAVNFAVTGALARLAEFAPCLQILHSAGSVTYEQVAAAYVDSPIQHCVRPFIRDMAAAYAVADLALCRAGGTSLAEITAGGVPAVLIPLPIAANDHQNANARVLERAGAAVVVDQRDLTPDRVVRIARELLTDERSLAAMSRAGRGIGVPDAAERVADRIIALLEQDELGAPRADRSVA